MTPESEGGRIRCGQLDREKGLTRAASEGDSVVYEPSRPAHVMGSVSCALSGWWVCSPSPGFSQGLMSTGLSLWLIENLPAALGV